MTHSNTTKSRDPGPKRREPTVARRPSAGLRSHPRRMEGLTRRMARCQEELQEMQREAINALDDAISRLSALDRCSRPGVPVELLAELEAALDEVRILDRDSLPRPEHLNAIAEQISRLNQLLPVSGEVAGGGPADAEDDRQPSSDSSGFHDATP